MFCKGKLGLNEAVEAFPVGRRLAFDGAMGRLWVICGHCARWNLSPLEERWEAIEECERRFRDARLRASTGNIGLVRLPEGVDLVRVGRPTRPEFAAWRYGDRLITRRRRSLAIDASLGVVTVGLIAGTSVAVPFVGAPAMALGTSAVMLWMSSNLLYAYSKALRLLGRHTTAEGSCVRFRFHHADSMRLLPSEGEDWKLRIRHEAGWIDLHGRQAVEVAGLVLPHINLEGAGSSRVQAAVQEIERAGGPEKYFAVAARMLGSRSGYEGADYTPHTVRLARGEIRLALEMAAHEGTERQALEGELHRLEAAWREAEEIAATADSLLSPAWVEERIRRYRATSGRDSRTAADDPV